MTQEYRSKVDDAIRMVLDGIEPEKNDSQGQCIHAMTLRVRELADAHTKDSMKGQRKEAIKLAQQAILYMVKFL